TGAIGAEGPRMSASQYIGVQLNNDQKTTEPTTTEMLKDSVPKIIVSNYSYEPKEAMAGQEVSVTLTYYNTSAEQTVKNIKISLDSAYESGGSGAGGAAPGGIFTPIEGSNTFYIDEMQPQSSVDRSIKLNIRADAEPKSYPLISEIEYEDSKNNPVTARESISIPVNQITKLMIGDVMYNMPEAYLGMGVGFSFQFINMGKTTLYNVIVSTEGPFDQQAESYYAGNMQSGMSDFFDGMVVPAEAGSVIGYVVIKYEDAAGVELEERRELELNVIDMSGGGDMMFMDGMEGWDRGEMMIGPDGMPIYPDEMGGDGSGFKALLARFLKPIPLIIAGAVLLTIIIVIVIIVKSRKKRKLERELEKNDEV
ncbi:MAG: hypothetical protein FWH55_09590, partial [Oscillospiraceae bacterium]|nr:hypothetical protein [Oscillospiraceae bacterium]